MVQNTRKKSSGKLYNKRLLVLLMFTMSLFFISSVSALEIDNIKKVIPIENPNSYRVGELDINYNTLWEKYPNIEVKNSFGLGKTLFQLSLTDLSEFNCEGENCFAEGYFYSSGDAPVYDGLNFYTLQEDGSWIKQNIRSWKVSYWGDISDYKTQCYDLETIVSKNGTSYTPQECNQVQIGSHQGWIKLNPKEYLAGNYKYRIDAKKKPSRTVDYRWVTNGKEIEDHAVWGNISLGDEAEVILNSPSNGETALTFLQTFNASTNVTNGAYITNMSLWTNITGTWALNETKSFSATPNDTYTDNSARVSDADFNYDVNALSEGYIKEIHTVRTSTGSFSINVTITQGGNVLASKVGELSGSTGIANVTFIEEDYSSLIQTGIFNIRILKVSGSDNPSKGDTLQSYSGSLFTITNQNMNTLGGFGGSKNGIVYSASSFITSSTQTWTKTITGSTLWNVQACDSDGDCGFATSNYTVSLDAEAPTIDVESPVASYDYGYPNQTLDVNVTFTDTNLDSCWYDYNGTNITIEGCLTGAKNSTNISVQEDNYNITFYANDSVGNENSSTVGWEYKVFEPSRVVNNQSYETQQETYSINLTANSSLTAVALVYNGTEYSTTNSGSVYNRTFDLPTTSIGNNSVRWKFTYAGDDFYSYYSYQNVSEIVFTICNASYTDDFLNITFKDEASLSYINASIPLSTFIYYLGSGSVNKTYTFTDTSDNFNYTFCATPDLSLNVDPYVQYKQGTDYPQRIWDSDAITLTSTVTEKILYLLNAVDGLYVTFQIINSAEQSISGVLATAIRTISGGDVTVGTGLTDAAGAVTFWLNPDFTHDFSFSKAGYTTFNTSFQPTQTTYTLTLGGGTYTDTDCTRGVSYTINPTGNFLDRDAEYDFVYTLSSDYWDVTAFNATLYYQNGTQAGTDTKTTNGGTITLADINVTNSSSMYLDYSYSVNDSVCFSSSRNWITQSTDGREFATWHFFTDLDLYLGANMFGAMGESGTDTFTKSLLAVLVLVLTVGILHSRYGIQSEAALMGIIFGVVLLLDYGLGFIPTIQIGSLVAIDYFVSFITFLILIGYIIKEERY